MLTILDKWRQLYPIADAAMAAIKEFENKYAEISLPTTLDIGKGAEWWWRITLYKGDITLEVKGQEPKFARDASVLQKIRIAAKLPELEKRLELSIDNLLKNALQEGEGYVSGPKNW